MAKFATFTQANRSKSPVLVNPEAVAAVTPDGENTAIHLRAPTVNAHGLQFTVTETLEEVAAALTMRGRSDWLPYTRRVERWNLASTALAKVGKMGVWG